MPKAYLTPKHQAFLRAAGADIRHMRERADVPQATVGELFGWNKDAVSKLERGVNTISLFEYLQVVSFFKEVVPGHPGISLARQYGLLK